jgi:hypothetical protein
MITIIVNKKTGAEERADTEAANRLKNSQYGENFDFKDIIEPAEIAEVAADHVDSNMTEKKGKK